MNRAAKRELRRSQVKEVTPHFNFLNELLNRFFQFLERKNKPTDQEVRLEFQNTDAEWKYYCLKHQLGTKASLLFNIKVSYVWSQNQKIRKRTRK